MDTKKQWFVGQLVGNDLGVKLADFANSHKLEPGEIVVLGIEGGRLNLILAFLYFAEKR